MNSASGPFRQVLVTGATGLVGKALMHRLVASGFGVVALSRDAVGARRKDSRHEVQYIESLEAVPVDAAIEAVVHLAGARVLDRRWTSARRRQLEVSGQMATAASHPPLARTRHGSTRYRSPIR
jgi:uncharacterized protein